MKLILPLCTLHNIWILNYWNSLWSTWSSLDWPTMLSVYNITTFSGVFPLKAYSMAFNWQKKLKGKIWVEIGGIENLNSEDQIQQMKWSVNGPKTSWNILMKRCEQLILSFLSSDSILLKIRIVFLDLSHSMAVWWTHAEGKSRNLKSKSTRNFRSVSKLMFVLKIK